MQTCPRRVHRTSWLSAALATIALVTVGCVDGGGTEGAGRSDEPTPLRVLMSDDWANAPSFVEAVRTFEAGHPNVRLMVDRLGAGDVMGTVQAMISDKAPPDVVQSHAFAAAARGLAQPVDDLWRAAGIKDAEFLPGAVDDVMWDGMHYGLPLDTNALVLFYNADHFTAANLPLPDTWQSFSDLERAAEALSRPDGSRRALVLSDSTWRAYGWMRANGGEVVDVGTDGRARCTIDAPANVATLRYLRGLIDRGLAFHPSVGAFTDDAVTLMRSGAASMFTSGSNDLVTLRKLGAAANIRIAVMPDGLSGTTEGSSMGGSSLFVPVGAAQRALGFEFMQHLTSDAVALRLAKEENRLPVRPRVYADPFFDAPESKVVLHQLRSARVYRLEAFAAARQAFGIAVRDALSGLKDPATALADAQAVARSGVPAC